VPVRNSGHLQFFQASDDDYRRTGVATSKGFQHGDAVHAWIEIDDNEIDVIEPGHKQFKSTPAVVCVPQAATRPYCNVGNDCIGIPRSIRYEKDISFHDYTSAGIIVVAYLGLLFSMQILRAEKRAEDVGLAGKKRAAFSSRP
jgi:hypothetical protein